MNNAPELPGLHFASVRVGGLEFLARPARH